MGIPKNYRLVPVELSPAIRDAIQESGCPLPQFMWASIIAKIDLVSGHTPVAPDLSDADILAIREDVAKRYNTIELISESGAVEFARAAIAAHLARKG